MGSEGEASPSTLQLPLFRMQPASPEPWSGMLTPLHTSASVPFRWEEEPGKPLPSTITTATSTPAGAGNQYCLELPPRLQLLDHHKMPSPTTVLDGPYLGGGGIQSSSSSFRLIMGRRRSSRRHNHGRRGGSFCSSYEYEESPERGQLGGGGGGGVCGSNSCRGRGLFFGSWRLTKSRTRKDEEDDDDHKEAGESSFVSSSSSLYLDYWADFGGDNSKRGKISRISRNGSSSISQFRSHLWASIYEGLKQMVPWKGRKSKKQGLIL